VKSAIVRNLYSCGAFPHIDGLLTIADLSAKYALSFHPVNRDDLVLDEDLVEIRKTITDSNGSPHVARSFIYASSLWCGLAHSEDVLIGDELARELSSNEVVALSPPLQFYSDSGDNFLFRVNFIASVLKGEQGDWVAYHHHHSGGDLEILWIGHRLCVRSTSHPPFEALSGAEVEEDEPICFNLRIDEWSRYSIAETHEEFVKAGQSSIPLPVVFSRGGEPGVPRASVELLSEPWTIERWKELYSGA